MVTGGSPWCPHGGRSTSRCPHGDGRTPGVQEDPQCQEGPHGVSAVPTVTGGPHGDRRVPMVAGGLHGDLMVTGGPHCVSAVPTVTGGSPWCQGDITVSVVSPQCQEGPTV